MHSLREEHCKPYLTTLQLWRHSDHLLFGLLLVARAHWGPEWRLQADYNDVKVRHGGGTWRLSDRDAGSLRRAGVKCHSLSGGNAAGIWEITGTSPLFSFSNAPPFILFLFSSFPFLRFVLPVLSLLLRLPSLSSHFYPFPFLPSLYMPSALPHTRGLYSMNAWLHSDSLDTSHLPPLLSFLLPAMFTLLSSAWHSSEHV